MSMPRFFDPMLLAGHTAVYQALDILPAAELHELLWRVRRAEIAADAIPAETLSEIRDRFLAGLRLFNLGGDWGSLLEHHLHAVLHETPVLLAYAAAKLGNDTFLRDFVTWHGRERLDAALAAGKGAILMQPHWGSFQMAFPMLVAAGYSVQQLFGDPEAAAWALNLLAICRPESAARAQAVTVGKDHVVKAALSALKSNRLFCIPFEVSDGAPAKLKAAMLGQTVSVPEGPYRLAVHSGAPLLPIYLETSGPCLHLYVGQACHVNSAAEVEVQAAVDSIYTWLGDQISSRPFMWRGWHFLDSMLEASGPAVAQGVRT